MSTLHLSYGRVVALSEHAATADMKRLQRQIATHCASDLADKSTVTCSDRYGPALTMFALCWKCSVNLRLQMTFKVVIMRLDRLSEQKRRKVINIVFRFINFVSFFSISDKAAMVVAVLESR